MRTFLVASLILVVEIFAVMLFLDDNTIRDQIQDEYQQTADLMGSESTKQIYDRADAAFRHTVVESGVYDKSFEMFVPKGERDMNGQNAIRSGINWFEERLVVFWGVVFRSYQRWSLFATWLPYTLLLLVPAAVDGWSQRAIKKDTFGFASPVRYAGAFYVVVGLIVVPMVYFIAPFAITPLLPPIWALLLTVSVLVLAANTQKHI